MFQTGMTPLYVAALVGHTAVVKLILEANPPASIHKAEMRVG